MAPARSGSEHRAAAAPAIPKACPPLTLPGGPRGPPGRRGDPDRLGADSESHGQSQRPPAPHLALAAIRTLKVTSKVNFFNTKLPVRVTGVFHNIISDSEQGLAS